MVVTGFVVVVAFVTECAITDAVDGDEMTFVVFVGLLGVVEFPEAVDVLSMTPFAPSAAVAT